MMFISFNIRKWILNSLPATIENCMCVGKKSFQNSNVANAVRLLSDKISGTPGTEINIQYFRHLVKDEATERKVKLILMEFAYCKLSEPHLPDALSEMDMTCLLDIESPTGREKYILRYMHSCHLHKLSQQRKREQKMKEKQMIMQSGSSEEPNHLQYMLGHNSLHFRVRNQHLKMAYSHRLAQAAMFGQSLVFDLDFDNFMNRKECTSTALQLNSVYGVNYCHSNPFDLVLCNLCRSSEKYSTLQNLEVMIPNLYKHSSMVTASEKSYLELFPDRNKLIYLSPDARETMDYFDNDAVYIIGAYVDLGKSVPRTFMKAKEDNIRSLKLPLDKYLLFKGGACKNLPLYQVFHILLELHMSGDWKKALQHLPRRAVLSDDEIRSSQSRSMERRKSSMRPSWNSHLNNS